ncbi:Dot/Icm T4SS effector CoxDFB5 [Coxiella burnetii]|uniref:Dot/Icm T4SS effector CoxDFB5 n=1 Tax=Coxiella burnetii TaxID=777 RepID=UPI000594FD59|nr:Dot/Icm T4SS effector CoxDFB5 [Coxiella burnetii]ATN75045.1 hypothetical protein AYM90_08735 [Coxiella burnetii]ATN76950.1 hypothetical protein AYM94_08750 [Coxiella burnetii]ATN78867.1 hypothetical protein AYM93_08745 [Coxiella burnetii]ATN80774.1 hypothetical protein AYN00_08715 [Coxiella burnetii]OYK89703.1 hypothetical protein CbuQ195_08970 [Coxiella burnetii]
MGRVFSYIQRKRDIQEKDHQDRQVDPENYLGQKLQQAREEVAALEKKIPNRLQELEREISALKTSIDSDVLKAPPRERQKILIEKKTSTMLTSAAREQWEAQEERLPKLALLEAEQRALTAHHDQFTNENSELNITCRALDNVEAEFNDRQTNRRNIQSLIAEADPHLRVLDKTLMASRVKFEIEDLWMHLKRDEPHDLNNPLKPHLDEPYRLPLLEKDSGNINQLTKAVNNDLKELQELYKTAQLTLEGSKFEAYLKEEWKKLHDKLKRDSFALLKEMRSRVNIVGERPNAVPLMEKVTNICQFFNSGVKSKVTLLSKTTDTFACWHVTKAGELTQLFGGMEPTRKEIQQALEQFDRKVAIKSYRKFWLFGSKRFCLDFADAGDKERFCQILEGILQKRKEETVPEEVSTSIATRPARP